MLEILKFLGFGVAAAATIWGLLKKTSFEDDEGNKRLTSAGHVSVAFAIAGCLVSVAAYGFELSIKAAGQAKAAAEKAERDVIVREQRSANAADAARDRYVVLQQRLIASQAEQIHAAQLVQGLRAVAAERDARLRSLMLSGQVRLGTESNLRRTQDALVQIERLMFPLNELRINVVWDVPIRTREGELAVATLEAAVRRVPSSLAAVLARGRPDLPPGCELGRTVDIWTRWDRRENYGVYFGTGCSLYPTRDSNPQLAEVIPGGTEVIFDIDRVPDAAIGPLWEDQILRPSFTSSLAELSVNVRQNERSRIGYSLVDRALRIDSGPVEIPVRERGRIVSVRDLEQAKLIISPYSAEWVMAGEERRPWGNLMRPYMVIIEVQGRTYVIRAASFRRAAHGFFVADTIGRPE